MDALLVLEDGRAFAGRAFGAPTERGGEVVFNTAMTGYQEVLTDPSYRGQIVVMTCAHVGNYGTNLGDVESAFPQVSGFAVRDVSTLPSSRKQFACAERTRRASMSGPQRTSASMTSTGPSRASRAVHSERMAPSRKRGLAR